MRVAGIDPGTVTLDVCVLEDGAVVAELSFPSAEIARDPAPLLARLAAHAPLALVAGPAGYGLPLVRGEDLGERELSLAVLVRADEAGADVGVGGLRWLLRTLAGSGLPLVLGPGVVHLPTVPAHRKRNRIDLGTADKVAAVASALQDQAGRRGVPVARTSAIVLELGGAFTAAVAVADGAIVDGLGGSAGPAGARGCGALDAEVACLLAPRLSKRTIFAGGALDPDGARAGASVAQLRADPALDDGWTALEEGAAKAVLALTASVAAPYEIALSGRLAADARLRDGLARRLAHVAPVRRAGRGAAHGAALIADGLAGGCHGELVAALRLREAAGTALDHLDLPGAEEIALA